AFQDPIGPVLPPTAGVLLGAGQPFVGVRARLAAQVVAGFGVAGRVDQAGDVPGVAQHECTGTGDELGGPIAAPPGGQMVGDPTRDIGGNTDPIESHWGAQYGQTAGPTQHV